MREEKEEDMEGGMREEKEEYGRERVRYYGGGGMREEKEEDIMEGGGMREEKE